MASSKLNKTPAAVKPNAQSTHEDKHVASEWSQIAADLQRASDMAQIVAAFFDAGRPVKGRASAEVAAAALVPMAQGAVDDAKLRADSACFPVGAPLDLAWSLADLLKVERA